MGRVHANNKNNMLRDPFQVYISNVSEPDKTVKRYIWQHFTTARLKRNSLTYSFIHLLRQAT